MKVAILVSFALLASATPALARQEAPIPAAPEVHPRMDELDKWLEEYRAWEKWFEQWGNRVQKNFNNQPIWERMPRPTPPAWLEAECRGDSVADETLATACNLLRHWDEQPLLILQRQSSPVTTSGGQVDDEVKKTSFLRRVHLTGLWMEARYPAMPAYGIVGMQVGVFEAGRFTLPAVGFMLVMIPDGEGGHAWKPATTLGFGFWLFDFVPPLMTTQVGLHLNIARIQLHGVQGGLFVPTTTNVHLFGLSVSTKRRP